MKNITRTQYQAFPYHLVEPSPWPILSSFAMLTLTVSAVLYFHCFILLGLENYSTNLIQYDCSTTMGKFDVNFLLFSSLLPVKPDESLSSKRLTRLERQQISLPDNLKQISF